MLLGPGDGAADHQVTATHGKRQRRGSSLVVCLFFVFAVVLVDLQLLLKPAHTRWAEWWVQGLGWNGSAKACRLGQLRPAAVGCAVVPSLGTQHMQRQTIRRLVGSAGVDHPPSAAARSVKQEGSGSVG